MPLLRVAAIAALSLSLLTACGREEPAGPAPGANRLLGFAPANTPYLAGNLAPVPNDVIDAFLQRAAPVLDAVQAEISSARSDAAAKPAAQERGIELLFAVLETLDGKLNRSGLESLGLDFQADQVLYGLGAFPVLRVGLADADIFRATIQQVLDRGGIAAPAGEFQGRPFWRIPTGTAADDSDALLAGLYVAIVDGHVAVSLFPSAAEADFLPHLLGLEATTDSDAERRLQAIAQRFGYQPYGIGMIDMLGLADELMNPASVTTRVLAGIGINLPGQLSDVCWAEYRSMVANLPAVFMGTTAVTPQSIGIQYTLETEPTLAAELTGLVAKLPLASALSSRVLELSFALKFGSTRDFLRHKAQAISESPYQCDQLLVINERAAEAFSRLNLPMPPLVNNFQGLRASISRLAMDDPLSANAEGLLAVHVNQPEMFVAMAQMFVPDLAAVPITRGGPPVQLPGGMVPFTDRIIFAALGNDAIGLSLGAGEEDRLMDFLDSQADNASTAVSINYNTAGYLEIATAVQQRGAADGPDDGTPADPPVVTIAEAIQQVQRSMAGRTWLSVRFTADGIVIDHRTTYR